MYKKLKARLSRVLPDLELRHAAQIAAEVEELKRRHNAVIVAHNYMEPALFYSVADLTGDSLDLSRRIKEVPQQTVVFCGVRFMAEGAAILAPQKTVLLPAERAGCSLAEAITAEDVRRLRELVPDAPVVTYVNSYADVKAESDICCTSSNAAHVIEKLAGQGARRIIFLPDEYLARNTGASIGWRLILARRGSAGIEFSAEPSSLDRVIIGWAGHCEVHERFTVRDVENARRQFPDVTVLAHPECPPEVIAAADFSGSTNAMIRYVAERQPGRLLLLTECAMADNIQAAHPEVEVLRLCSLRCPHMNEITLQQVKWSLENQQYRVTVEEAVATRARSALEKMIEMG